MTVEVTPRKAGCELALTHAGLPPDRADQIEARWTGILYGLGETLASASGGRLQRHKEASHG